MAETLRQAAKTTAYFVIVVLFIIVSLMFSWYFRENQSTIAQELDIEVWAAVSNGKHNSNTDLIYWQDYYYLVHASSPWHFASDYSRLVVRRSPDAVEWQKVAVLDGDGDDIRDPKFAVFEDRLYIFALKNRDFTAEPYVTVFSSSAEGVFWTPFEEFAEVGWLFWRPKTQAGSTWYVPAYWYEHGKSALLTSDDGEQWEIVSEIYQGQRNDETAVEFLPDGRLLATARLEGTGSYFGDSDSGTLIAVSEPPFETWTYSISDVTRLDGPTLFTYDGLVFAAARYQPEPRAAFTQMGSIFSRKRTSLFLVEENRLVYLTDLPSAGDTSYTGVVLKDGYAYISYYTSDVNRDFPWIMGMIAPSDIYIARISLDSLTALARDSR